MKNQLLKKTPGTRRLYRGQWSGLSAITVSKLMGCSIQTAKVYLYKLEKPVDLNMIGALVYEYRLKQEMAGLNKFL